MAEHADGKGAIVQKDRFIFAIIIYGLIMLAGAGVCSALLPGDVSAVANAGVEEGNDSTSQPDETQVHPPMEPGQSVANGDNDEAEKEKPLEQGKPEDRTPDETGKQDERPDETMLEQEEADGAWALLSAKTTAAWREIIGERCIVLQKPESDSPGRELLFSLTEMPVERSIALRVQGCKRTEYGYDVVERIAGERYFVSEPLAPEADRNAGEDADGFEEGNTAENVVSVSETEKDPLRSMKQSCTPQEDGSYELYVELLLDKTYVYNVYETETHYFIALKEAKEVYDKVVVLDAGHGGWDTGTPSKDGKVLEKNINLQVLLYLEEMLAAENVKVYATRTTDRYIGHAERITLANVLEADLFLSIHCNNAYQDAEARGTEVLYTQYCTAEGSLNSEKLAQLCQEELVAALQLNHRGIQARGDDLTVLQKAEVPAVQVELAFMSNAEDMNLLKTDEAQRKAAEALYRAVMRAFDAMLE